jgi:predicted dehydrogenase
MTPVKIALIGVGGFGASHIRTLRRLRLDNQVELLAVADPALEDHGSVVADLRESGVVCHKDFFELLNSTPDLEAVILCTPIPLHKEMAAECLRRGLFVYLEKPPVVVLSDLMDLIRMDPDQKTAVGFIGVVPDVVREVKARILSGEIGARKAIRIAASWPRPSWYYQRNGWAGKLGHKSAVIFDGPATNALSHYVHLASFLAGDTPGGHKGLHSVRAELYRARAIESYDTCSILGQFENGVEFNIALTHACRHRVEVDVRLEGSVRPARILIDRSAVVSDLTDFSFDSATVLESALRNFVERIRWGTRCFTTLEDCIPFLEVVSGMWLSSGGIHTIDEDHYEPYGQEPNTILDIHGLPNLLERSLVEGGTFSDLRTPWGIETEAVTRDQIAGFSLQEHLMREHGPVLRVEGAVL